jgi:probable HAF family extracellular repeat protein
MRNTRFVILSVAGLTLACGEEAGITRPATSSLHQQGPPQYTVVKYDASLGGTNSRGYAINNRGWVAGFSNLAGNTSRHAALWRDGAITDLGTLGGPNSAVFWPGLNDRGLVVGIAQTADPEPLGESWSCAAFFPGATGTGKTCLGFVWKHGVMSPLPTFGGNNGYAAAVNDNGRIVGWAETTVHDPTCVAPQVLQFRAAVWIPKRNRMRQLRPLPGDSTSAATAINDRGHVDGISGDCDIAVGRFSARHAIRWRHGVPSELPNLGGISWHTPTAINNRGDIVGFSNPPGDPAGEFIAHAVLWPRHGGIEDLGTLPGDQTSQALGINSRGRIVGLSAGAITRAVLWHDGVAVDLNTLVGPEFTDRLVTAAHINERGQITGRLLELSTNRTLMFVATPVHDDP